MKNTGFTRIVGVAFAALLAWGGSAAAQADYPTSTVSIIVPFSTGGGTDTAARIIADALSKSLGQPVIVENRPGANGIVGTSLAAQADPDGYTLALVLHATMALNPVMYKATNYDPIDDFAPIGLISRSPYVLVVNPEVKAGTLGEFVALAREAPGEINYASGASTAYLAAESLQRAAGFEMTHIPYKGSGPAITDVLGGRVEAMISSPVSVLPHLEAGTLRALAVTSAERSRVLPEVPTVAESGYPGFEVAGWYGLAAPAGTPEEIIDELHAALAGVLAKPEVQAKMQQVGVETASSDLPEDFAAYIARQAEVWATVVKDVGIQPK